MRGQNRQNYRETGTGTLNSNTPDDVTRDCRENTALTHKRETRGARRTKQVGVVRTLRRGDRQT